MMTTTASSVKSKQTKRRGRRRCCYIGAGVAIVLFVLVVAFIAVAVAASKAKDPILTMLSTSVTGISPAIIFPTFRIELNLTIFTEILVYNPNPASFQHDQGSSELFFHGDHVGSANLPPGRIPAKGSEKMDTRITLQLDKLATDLSLIGEVISGVVHVDSISTVPGRVTFLGIIHHRAVSTARCQTAIHVKDMKVQDQSCTYDTKL